MRRVAVTGIGLLSALGNNPNEMFEAARIGYSGIRRLDFQGANRLKAPLAATVTFDGSDHFDPPQQRILDRVSQFAVVAARRAFVDAHCELTELERERTGVFLGTGMGGTMSIDDGYQTLYGRQSDRINPMMIIQGMHNAAASWIAIEHKLSGPNLTFSTACSSSSVAIGEAWLRLASGMLDLAIAGGSEAPLSLGSLKAWEAMHTLASVDVADPSSSCKPFSKNRSGMVLGEGSAFFVLEPWDRALARSAPIYGEIIGYGLTTDSSNIAKPSVAGQAASIRSALASARININAVDSINAHGTGTVANDSVETLAIKQVFGTRAYQIPISATKALHGHLLGAAGALEFALSLLALRHNVALPTMHLKELDAQCDLDYVPNVARPGAAGKTMLSHSFAFGGTNSVLVMRAND